MNGRSFKAQSWLRIAAALGFLLMALATGYAAARQANTFMAITFAEKPLPPESPCRPASLAEAIPPPSSVAAIVLPPRALTDDLYRRAAGQLADALAESSGTRPALVEAGAALPLGQHLVVGGPERNPLAPAMPSTPADPESFALYPYLQAGQPALAVVGGSRNGDVYGLYWLVDALYQGQTDVFTRNLTLTPALRYRLVDMGGVGIPYDPAAWSGKDYSHTSRAFQDLILPGPPYVDPTGLRRVEAQFQDYVQRMIAYGNNGIVFGGFLEFVDFAYVEDGSAVYGPDSPYRHRHQVLRQAFGQLFSYAHATGLRVILDTDMLALTPPLESYLRRRFGSLDTSNPDLWAVYRQGLEELFDVLPAVDGVMVRIGEAGSIYNLEGWDYYSRLEVTHEKEVQMMLEAFLEAAETRNKVIIFRTWSVGVGEIGDMHTNPKAYQQLLQGFSSPRLIVSTKFVQGDFDSYLPFNPTLFVGSQPRLVEFQARREFEGFGAFPNYLGPLHQEALKTLLAGNPHIQGMWLWTQGGGPLRAGPLSLYPFHGLWHLTDANVYVTSRLAWEPHADLDRLTSSWVRRTFGHQPQVVAALTEVLCRSREPVLKGLYLAPFARQELRALGFEATPNLLIFKWDIVSGDNSTLSTLYSASRNELDAAIEEGFQAAAVARALRKRVEELSAQQCREPALCLKLAASLAYEEDLLETLAWYRRAFLSYYRWLERGEPTAWRAWEEAYRLFRERMAAHQAKYSGNLDFPAYNFEAVEVGMAHAWQGKAMAWVARLVLVVTGGVWLAGLWPAWQRPRDKRGIQLLALSVFAPWRLRIEGDGVQAGTVLACLIAAGLLGLGFATFSSFRSFHFAGWMLVSLAGYGLAAVMVAWGRRTISLVATLGPALMLNTLFMGVVAVRGPLFFWQHFWMDAGFRIGFITLGLAAGLWLFYAWFWICRGLAGLSALSALGGLLILPGSIFTLNGLLGTALGFEAALRAVNNEMAILPLGLSKMMGMTTNLNLPADLPAHVARLGGISLGLGVLLRIAGARHRRRA